MNRVNLGKHINQLNKRPFNSDVQRRNSSYPSIALPLPLYLFSYLRSDLFSSNTYPSSSPNIPSSKIFTQILVLYVSPVLFLQNFPINLINIPLSDLLPNQLMCLTLVLNMRSYTDYVNLHAEGE